MNAETSAITLERHQTMNILNIGLHGLAGHQIVSHIPQLQRARITDVAGVSKSEYAVLKSDFPEVFANTTWHPELNTMLDQGAATLISFCSNRRDDQCAEAICALEAGRHVLLEKPMATSLEDLNRLHKAWKRAGTELRTMTTMIYEPCFSGMKAIVESGAVGEVVQCYGMKSYPFYDSRPQDRGIDGGIIQAMIHAVSFIRYVTDLEFTEVFMQDTGQGNPRNGDLQMAANLTGRLSNGALTSIVCNYCNPPGIGFWGNEQLRVHGTGGMIELTDGLTRRSLACADAAPKAFPDIAPETSYPQDLINCILDGSGTLLTATDSFRNTEVVLCAGQSAAIGQPVNISDIVNDC